VIGRDLGGCGAHTRGELPLGVRRDRLVTVGDEEPGRQRLPGGGPHHFLQCGGVQRLLHRVHHPRLARIDVGREVIYEVVFGQPSEAVLVDVKVRERRARRRLSQQGSDRFAFVKPEGSDVDQSDDIRRIFTECRDDLTSV
jgi:hypothetical protein